jgi:3-oxoadipate enol-lactonase
MAIIQVNETLLYYEDTGGSGAPILFSHGLLWDTTLFAPQVAAFRGRYRCIAYDHRGQGKSADGTGNAIDMETLAADAAALIETLRLGPVHFCGLSMGGFIAMRLAASRPDLIRSLILLETSADPESFKNVLKYRMLNLIARFFSVRLVAHVVMPVMFGKSAIADPTRTAERLAWRGQLIANRRSIWRAANGVIKRKGVYDKLATIAAPTLVIVGDEDVATVPAKAERIARAIKGAKLICIPYAGHSATVEQPEAVTAAIAAFLDEVSANGQPVRAAASQHSL